MSSQTKPLKILFGAAAFGADPAEKNQEFLDVLTQYNVVDLDTANIYVRAHLFHLGLGGETSADKVSFAFICSPGVRKRLVISMRRRNSLSIPRLPAFSQPAIRGIAFSRLPRRAWRS